MKVVEQPGLGGLNTFGVEATAGLMIEIEGEEDLLNLPAFDPSADLVLGGGSNLLLVSDVPGTVFHNRILGRQIVEDLGKQVIVEVGGGEDWHAVVDWSLEHGLSGLENLSLIPGQVGAAPIQNIGAYGVELASVVEFVTAWDWHRSLWTSFGVEECAFAYRDSLFKSIEPDRYLITSVGLRLNRVFTPRLEYGELAARIESYGGELPNARQISNLVIELRRHKIPHPRTAGNAGSFFKNPVVDQGRAEAILARYGALPAWPAGKEQLKLSAAWMIDFCGLKGHRVGGAAVSDLHALVLVNLDGASGSEVMELAGLVRRRVTEEFGIQLEIEPKIVNFGR